jgi:hypothetical protein
LGTVQKFTLTGNTTFTNQLVAGESALLQVASGGFSATWPNTVWVGNITPTFPGSGFIVVVFWQIGSILYGSYIGNVSS